MNAFLTLKRRKIYCWPSNIFRAGSGGFNIMEKQNLLITNPTGLHARPATQLVALSKKYQADIVIECEGITVNPKNIFSVLKGKMKQGKTISVGADGPDAREAVNAICSFIHALEE
jgi:phosphotransferase system HPr (HPr) family protein